MEVQVKSAEKSDYAIIKNLVPYYIYDMSEYMKWDCNKEGRWDGCDDLPDYWEKADHYPYLILADGSMAGFALLRPFPDEPDRTEIAEIFVARQFKGQGIGRETACHLFDAFPGKWLVRVLEENIGARRFWDKIIREYTSGSSRPATETYTDPHSGSWPMIFYRFENKRL
jgi:predicted acetyltransferase